MALYLYLKSKSSKPYVVSYSRTLLPKKKKKPILGKRTAKVLPFVFIFFGLLLIGQVTVPLVGWYLFTLPVLSTPSIVSPLAKNFRPENSPLYPSVVRASEVISGKTQDDTYKLTNWFAGAKKPDTSGSRTQSQSTYTLSIPKLKVDSATVEIGGEDLKKSLVGWPTSPQPGNYGVIIIFGHSALPAFSSPKDYSSIFTHLMELTENDDVFIDSDGVRFRYKVFDKKIISPTDLSVLEQRFDGSYLTLITCEPPGTLWMRGVIKARLTQV